MLTRRQMVAGAATTATAAGLVMAPAQAQATPLVRRNIADLAANDPIIQTYRDAVRILRDEPRNPRVTWQTITNIHRDRCPHGNWYFLPWHRSYVVMMERIVRSVTNNRTFAMPYWDWSTNAQLPPAFTDPNSPLFVAPPRRHMTRSQRIPRFVMEEVPEILATTPSFRRFASSVGVDVNGQEQNNTDQRWIRIRGDTGRLEIPHGTVHLLIGNGVAADGAPVDRPEGGPELMSGMLSPSDPIFWLHHGYIDLIWAQWNRRGNNNTNDQRWLNMSFARHFLQPDGSPITAAGDLITTVRNVQNVLPLGYTYRLGPDAPRETQPDNSLVVSSARQQTSGRQPATSSDQPARATASNTASAAVGRPLEVAVTVSAATLAPAIGVQQPVASSEPAPGRPASGPSRTPSTERRVGRRVIARIVDVAPPKNALTNYRVFVNKDGVADTTPPDDPSYVTTLTFFGHDHSGHAGHNAADGSDKSTFAVDLTNSLNKLAAAGKFKAGDPVRVQIVAVGAGEQAVTTITPRQIEILVE